MRTSDGTAAAGRPGEGNQPARRDADLAVVVRWLRDYVGAPSSQLGRGGPVCPFVPPALSQEKVRFSFQYEVDGRDLRQLTTVLVEEMAAFRETAEPPGSSGSSLASLLVVLPDTGPTGWTTLDHVYAGLKDSAVEQGLMIGQFHPACDERAMRNTAFRVSRAPIALVAIRHMAPHDILFLHERPDWFVAYWRRFGEYVAAGRVRDPLLLERYTAALRRHGAPASDAGRRCRAATRRPIEPSTTGHAGSRRAQPCVRRPPGSSAEGGPDD